MARSIWKGAINFSLIHVPVSLHSAVKSGTLDLDMLDKRDFSPVGYQRINKNTGKTVDWKNIVKGYQYEKGEYVVLSEEDFRQANVEATGSIDIQSFVERDAIAPYHFDTPYYLLPEKGGEKVYALLSQMLQRSKKYAIASIVLRARQHLVALVPLGDVILLNTLRFSAEILAPPKNEAPVAKRRSSAKVTDKELRVAKRLIEEMSETWRPDQYHDTYREDLMKRIEQKIKSGKTKTLTRAQAQETQSVGSGKVVDLLSLLEQSLQDRRAPSSSVRRRRASRRSNPRRRTAHRA